MTSNPTDLIERLARAISDAICAMRITDSDHPADHGFNCGLQAASDKALAILTMHSASTPDSNTLSQQEGELEALRELLGRVAPFIGWASTRGQIIAGVEANEALCDEIDSALSAQEGGK